MPRAAPPHPRVDATLNRRLSGVAGARGTGHPSRESLRDAAIERNRQLGVRSAALLALALSVTWALSVPAFWGVDETSHAAYALAAADGTWPVIHTPNPGHDLPGMGDRLTHDLSFGRLGRLDIWTANHPPLYFVVAGIPLRLGLMIGHAGAGMVAARLLTALAGSAGVFAVAWVARSMAPGRPRLHVVAAFCAALSPTLVHYAGQIYNDTLGFTLSSFGLAAGFAALRFGLQPRLVLIGAVTAGAGALTRSSGFAPAAITVAAFMLAAWFQAPAVSRRGLLRAELTPRRDAPSWRQRLAPAIGVAALVGGAITAIAGWSVVVNIMRYGDPTAAHDLFQKFHRVEGPPWTTILFDARYLADQLDRLAAELSSGIWWPSTATRITFAVAFTGLVGGAFALVRRVRRRQLPDPRAAALGTLAVALPLLLLTASAVFISQGGNPHSRYLLPALAVLASFLAVGLEGLPGAKRGIPAIATLCAFTLANIALWLQFRADHEVWYQGFPFPVLPYLAPTWVAVSLGITLGTVAFAGLVRAIMGLSKQTSDR